MTLHGQWEMHFTDKKMKGCVSRPMSQRGERPSEWGPGVPVFTSLFCVSPYFPKSSTILCQDSSGEVSLWSLVPDPAARLQFWSCVYYAVLCSCLLAFTWDLKSSLHGYLHIVPASLNKLGACSNQHLPVCLMLFRMQHWRSLIPEVLCPRQTRTVGHPNYVAT